EGRLDSLFGIRWPLTELALDEAPNGRAVATIKDIDAVLGGIGRLCHDGSVGYRSEHHEIRPLCARGFHSSPAVARVTQKCRRTALGAHRRAAKANREMLERLTKGERRSCGAGERENPTEN